MNKESYKIFRKDCFTKKNVVVRDSYALLILGVVTSFMAFRKVPQISYLCQGIFVIYTLLWLLRRISRYNINKYVLIYGIFGIWCTLSIIWATDYNMAIKSIIATIQIIILCSCISFYINDVNSINRVLYIIGLSSIVMLIYFILKTPISEWIDSIYGSFSASTSQGRFGRSIGHHPNSFGDLCALSSLIWFYFYKRNGNRFNLLGVTIFFLFTLFSKSRLSLIILICSLMYFQFLCSNKKFRAMTVIRMIVLVIIISWAVFNIPILYNLVGYRLEGFLGIFSIDYIADASTNTRMQMIEYGIDMFKNNPILGVGLGNYAYYGFYKYGLFSTVYAHNNYIELLASIGIVGTILYYILPIWSCIKLKVLIKSNSKNERILCSFLYVIILSRLIGDLGRVSYKDEIVQIMNMICYSGALIFLKNKSNSRRYNND